jgi:hypothetical protein
VPGPNDTVDCALTRPKPEACILKVDLGQPPPTTLIVRRQTESTSRSRSEVGRRGVPRAHDIAIAYIVTLIAQLAPAVVIVFTSASFIKAR